MAETIVRRGGFGFGILRIVVTIIELVFVAMALILAFAFVLGLFGANPNAPFATWIYARAGDIMTPFNGLFDPITLTGDFQIHTSMLFALVVYALIAAALDAFANRFG